VILQNMDRGNEKNRPFFLSLLVNDFILHNCMLDSGATSNVMTKKVMEQLNLRISRPYHNICAMDSRTIEVHGLIKGLQVHLAAFPDIMIEMDIVVIDVPDTWGMLLNRKTTADLGGSLQMDLTYATIPTPNGLEFRLNRELERKYHVEDPRKKENEIVFREVEMGCYEIEHTPTFTKMELNSKPPSICNVWDPIVMIPSQIFRLESLTTTDLLMCRCLLSYPVIKCVHTRFIQHMKITIHSRYRSTSKDLTFYYEQYGTNTIDSRSGTILRWPDRQ
jgi:hypothetical protein